jgi:(4S)-4-hydroxy-5-phosphonooxypentane-2,3-dione isomerase
MEHLAMGTVFATESATWHEGVTPGRPKAKQALGGRARLRRPERRPLDMLTVFVYVKVKPDRIDAFKAASIENARLSTKEPGVARFDVLQQQDAPERFVLVEVYRTAQAPAAHKATAHYAAWRDAVAAMMEEPRQSTLYTTIFPDSDDP